MKVISTTWPFNTTGFRLTVEQTVARLEALHADEVCMRTPAYYLPYATAFHVQLAEQARAKGMRVSIWPVVSLYYPERQAMAVLAEVDRYRPDRVDLDAEGDWVELYGSNAPRFLDALGNPGCPVGLGSYRRPDLHPGVNWMVWLTHMTAGQHTISFQAHQMYPIGATTVAGWLADFKRSVDAWAVYEARAERADMPWLPWMPAFIGGGYEGQTTPWIPQVDCYRASTEYMVTRLGARLLGFNHWSLDKSLIDPRMKGVHDYVTSYMAPPPPVPFLDRPEEERWAIVRDDLLKRGVVTA